jgi:DNA-binding HxlR family transcriptional regulator
MAEARDDCLSLDVMLADCRARSVLTILAERWALLVIDALSGGALRTGELRRHIGGISEKMLIQTLRKLEALGLVERHDFRQVPPRVEYALTARGRSLSPLILALDRWVEANAIDMVAAPPLVRAGRPADPS